MFTGIIEEKGRVELLSRPGVLKLTTTKLSRRLRAGSSVCVNGVCLTVTKKQGSCLIFDLSPETLKRSNLGTLCRGDWVNLESPLTLAKTLDGHIVQGHVDAVGKLGRRWTLGKSQILEISIPKRVARWVVERGSVALDGVSLTPTWVNGTRFRVAIIPYTANHTTLGAKRPGELVNVEADLFAKYLERQVQYANAL